MLSCGGTRRQIIIIVIIIIIIIIILQANKEVFDARALQLQEYAESLGLPSAPRVRLQRAGKESKNWNMDDGGKSDGEDSGEGEGGDTEQGDRMTTWP